MEQPFRVQSKITPEIYREFTIFDTLRRQKRYKAPLLFALIMIGFSVVCFTQVGRRAQAGLLGGVLLTVGILLPAVYILTFLNSVNKKAKQLERVKNLPAYTVELSPERVTATAGKERLEYIWNDILYVYRLQRCIALFVAAGKAFVLPVGDDGDDALWTLICEHIPESKRENLHKQK